MKRSLLLLSILSGLTFFAAHALQAAIIQSKNLTEMTRDADAIVVGRVSAQWTAWDRDHRYIWTHTEVIVDESWKGGSQSRLTISELGGIVDGVGMSVAGTPLYQIGERVVIFARRMPTGILRTASMSLGKLEIVEGAGEAASVRSDLADLASVDAAGTVSRSAAVVPNGTSLNSLKNRVLSLVGNGGGK